jgi:Mg/Co/Ni transporter MgtE
MRSRVATVRGDDDLRKVQETVTKYDLLALPVVDEQGVLLGIIRVDDVMETVFPDRGGLESFTDFMTHSKSWMRWKP